MDENIREIVENVSGAASKFGIHMESVGVAALDRNDPDNEEALVKVSDLKEKLKSGDVAMFIITSFRLGDLAFSDRIQNPGQAKQDVAFAIAAPTEFEMASERLRRNIEAGRSPFDDGEDD